MTTKERETLLSAIDSLAFGWRGLNREEFEEQVARVVGPILRASGFTMRDRIRRGPDDGFDMLGHRAPEDGGGTLGVVVKKYESLVSISQIREILGASIILGCDRALLVTTSGFTRSAVEAASRTDPVSIELMDLARLRDWVANAPVKETDDIGKAYLAIVSSFCRQLAQHVARDPAMLDHLEWRELEKMLREVLHGIGFDVELTRCSKDGGKDLIVFVEVRGHDKTFYIEVKHWTEPSRPGKPVMTDFIKVLVQDKIDIGIVLSSSGFALNAFEGLAEIEKRRIRVGGRAKVISLCQTYVRARSGLWSPRSDFDDLLLEETFEPADATSALLGSTHGARDGSTNL